MKILHLEKENYPDTSLSVLQSMGQIHFANVYTQSDLDNLLLNESFDAVFVRLGFEFGSKNLHSQSQLQYIVSPTTGLNHLDLSYLDKRDIKVISLKGDLSILERVKSTAEHTWSLLMALTRNLRPAIDITLNFEWKRKGLECDELNDMTLGIIGFGRLGMMVAGYGKAFGMKVLVNDCNPEKEKIANQKGFETIALDDILSNSDVLILMADYNPGQKKILDEPEFEKLKKGSYFINTSRGELINENALLFALKNGSIKAAALDVLEGDSVWDIGVTRSHPLLAYARENSNLIITPHIGGYGKQSIRLTREYIVNKFREEYFKNQSE